MERQTAAARAALEVQLSAMSVEQLKQRASGTAGPLKQTLSPEKLAENAAKTLLRSSTKRLQDDFKNTHWSQIIDSIVRSGDTAELLGGGRAGPPSTGRARRAGGPGRRARPALDAEHAERVRAMRGTISPGRYSHPDTILYISLVTLHTTYTGQHMKDFNVHAQARSST